MTRDEAIKILKGAVKKPNTKDGYLGQAVTMAIRSLEAWDNIVKEMKEEIYHYDAMPDVVEVVHGKWIKDWEIGCSDCSHCGKGYLWEDYKGVADWKYCPNCGARMEGEK